MWKHVVGDSVTFTGDNDPDVLDENTPLQYRTMSLQAVAIDGSDNRSEISRADYVIDLVDAFLNVPYDAPPPEGGSKHQLDIYHPIGEKNTPVLLFIHGGAWKTGDKNIYMELANTFAGYYGITTVAANYELSAEPWYAVFPDHILDIANAFAWVYEHIDEYGGDPENIYLFGQSAGAHLVSLLATDSNYLTNHGLSLDKIKGVIAMSGAYELYDLAAWPSNPNGLTAAEVLEYKALFALCFGNWEQSTLNSYSPQEFIKPNQPPFRIIALNETETFEDMPGFSSQANNFYSAILALNASPVELKILNEEDIPLPVRQMDFPADKEGHYQEIYAINTRDWYSESTRMVSEVIQTAPEPPELLSPQQNEGNVPPFTNCKWQKSRKALYYQLQISEYENFPEDSLRFDANLADTVWKVLLEPEKNYYWRVRSFNGMGYSSWSETRNFATSQLTGIERSDDQTPESYLMMSAYPNPFNGVLRLNINLPVNLSKEICTLNIFNVLGEKVYAREISLNSGKNILLWQPENLTSGTYLVQLKVQRYAIVNKVGYVK